MLLQPKEAAEYYGVTQKTLRLWAKQGKIDFVKTSGNQNRYKINISGKTKRKISYARVSSRKQEKDLESQVEYLERKYPTHQCLTDIGSGLNYKRNNFKTILEELFKGNIEEVVVAYKDRFTRFGWELFEWIFTVHGAKLVALQSQEKTKEEELAEDLMAIVHSFSSRGYG